MNDQAHPQSSDAAPEPQQPLAGRPLPEQSPVEQAIGDDPVSSMLSGGLDLGAMMQAAQSMQQQMADAQQELGRSRIEGTAGGGLVTVTLNGHLHLLAVSIKPEAIDADDPSILEDLVRAAWQDAHDQVAVLQQQADPMAGLLGGGSLGGLGDLLGGI